MAQLIQSDILKAGGQYSELNEIRNFVLNEALECGLPQKKIDNVVLAVDEACSNLIRYGLNFSDEHYFTIKIQKNENFFQVQISDNSPYFNLLETPPINIVQYFTEMQPGGLGIHLIKSIVDKIDYVKSENSNEQNTLYFTMFI